MHTCIHILNILIHHKLFCIISYYCNNNKDGKRKKIPTLWRRLHGRTKKSKTFHHLLLFPKFHDSLYFFYDCI